MKSLSRQIFSLVLFLLLTTAMSYSQVIPTGKLVGTITDNEGLELPGVTVTISSPSLILPQMSTVSNERGYYRFVELPSGVYKVVFEMPGMKTLNREGIVISVGRTTTLNIMLEQSEIQEEVTVVGEAPVIDLQSSAIGYIYTQDLITTLPVQRTFEAFYNLAPGMYDSAALGSDVRSNKFTVDGMTSKRVESGMSGVNIGFDSIEEIMVDTGGHKAEYGNVRGAVVQIITKSGGNKFSGELNAYYRNKSLQSDNTKGTPFEGQFVGFDFEVEPGFSLGGPIMHDKLWFFVSFNMRRQDVYLQGYPALSEQNIPVNQDFYTPFGKLTWQISSKDKIVASSWWRGDYTDHFCNSTPRLTTEEGSSIYNDYSQFHSLQWTRAFSDDFIFSLRGGYFKLWNDMTSKTQIQRTYDMDTGILTTSGEEWTTFTSRYQANTVATYYADQWYGSHELKIGADFEFAKWHNWYVFHEDPQLKGKYEPNFYIWQLYMLNNQPYMAFLFEDIDRRCESLLFGGFIQDTWSPMKSLTFNIGLRFDHIEGRYPRQLAPGKTDVYTYEKTVKPISWNRIAPRLSLSFDPFGDGKTVFKAGYGKYFAPLNMHAIAFAMKGGFSYFFVMLNPDYTEDYRFGLTRAGDIEWDPDSKAPYGDEITLSVSREIFPNFALSVTYIQKWEKNLLERLDANGLDVDLFRSTGELNWTAYHIVQGTDPETNQTIEFYEQNPDKEPTFFYHTNVPGTARTYKGLEVKLTKRMSNNWALLVSYNFSRGRGLISTSFEDTWTTTGLYVNPNFTTFYRRGLLEHQREHYLKIQGTYMAPYGFMISGYFQAFSGAPFTRTIRSLEAGLSLYQGTATRNAEPRGSSKNPGNYLLDFRLEKRFNIGPRSLGLTIDVFNVFNSNKITTYGSRTVLDYMTPTGITSPRYIRIGAGFRF